MTMMSKFLLLKANMKHRNKVFFGHVEDSKILLDWDAFKKYASTLKGDIQVLIGKRQKQRSLNANALYWLWLTVIEGETGQDKDELHDFFKTKFLKTTKQVFGKVYEVVQSSALLDTIDFMAYMDKVRQFALSELNISLPDAEQ